MIGKNYFDISRFWKLLKLEVFQSRKALLYTFVIAFGLHFFMGILLEPAVDYIKVYDSHPAGYAFSMLIGGFILSSLAFNDLRNTLRRFHYLTLPVSTLERFFCMWLLTSVGWILLFTITFTIYTWIANPIGQLVFRNVTFRAFDPFGSLPLNAMKYYFVLQGIFLVGAVHFRGYVFPKTLFTLILFGMICTLIAYFFMKDIMYPEIEDIMSIEPNPLENKPVYQFWLIFKWLFWWIMPPLCWVMAYIGLKDQEVQ
jgi:hypothetical protein